MWRWLLSVLLLMIRLPQERDWRAVNDFLYQLQNTNVEAITATDFDLVVMDISELDTEGVDLLHESDKLVLCYMSIGEAETYRWYWDESWETDPPSWLDEENPDWEGNYKVRYWEPEWQALIYGSEDAYLDQILALGCDGAYLDIVDAYEYYADERDTAAQEMVDFVLNLAAYAREFDPEFGVFPQNAEGLGLEFPDYLDAMTGIGVEDVYYGYPDDNIATTDEWRTDREAILDEWIAAGKLVLTIDYTEDDAQIADAYTRSRARGYVPYVANRDLDALRINPGFEPE
jgi:cysteinyl-tRNA synthetase, unknown class